MDRASGRAGTHWGDKQAANRTAKDYGDGVKTMASDNGVLFVIYGARRDVVGFWDGANILREVVADVTSRLPAPIFEDILHRSAPTVRMV